MLRIKYSKSGLLQIHGNPQNHGMPQIWVQN